MKHPNAEQLGEPQVTIAGLQIWVHGREFPGSQDEFDYHWLRVTAHCGGRGASVWASGSILMVTDLSQWSHESQALVCGDAVYAELAPLEPNLKVSIRPVDSLGHFSVHVQITPDQLSQDHSFEFEVDQTEVRALSTQCAAIAAKYGAGDKSC